MKPVLESDVIELLNNGRFSGNIEAYIMADGKDMLGHSLFEIKGETTTLFDAKANDMRLLDGIIRASIAKGQSVGATGFAINEKSEQLSAWAAIFLKGMVPPYMNEQLFKSCC